MPLLADVRALLEPPDMSRLMGCTHRFPRAGATMKPPTRPRAAAHSPPTHVKKTTTAREHPLHRRKTSVSKFFEREPIDGQVLVVIVFTQPKPNHAGSAPRSITHQASICRKIFRPLKAQGGRRQSRYPPYPAAPTKLGCSERVFVLDSWTSLITGARF